jgi:hypothetical protein
MKRKRHTTRKKKKPMKEDKNPTTPPHNRPPPVKEDKNPTSHTTPRPPPVADEADTQKERTEKIEAYLRLVHLDAAPAISFDPHSKEYVDAYAAASAAVQAERYAEIQRNRKILEISTRRDQMNVNEPPASKLAREKAEGKKEGKIMTTESVK